MVEGDEDPSMYRFGSVRCVLAWSAFGFSVLAAASLVGPAFARQVLYVGNPGNNTVGAYNAVTGGTINAAIISGQGLNNPVGITRDGNNHFFVTNADDRIGQYNATTGATIDAAFINGQGLNHPDFMVFVPAVPEPGSLAFLARRAPPRPAGPPADGAALNRHRFDLDRR